MIDVAPSNLFGAGLYTILKPSFLFLYIPVCWLSRYTFFSGYPIGNSSDERPNALCRLSSEPGQCWCQLSRWLWSHIALSKAALFDSWWTAFGESNFLGGKEGRWCEQSWHWAVDTGKDFCSQKKRICLFITRFINWWILRYILARVSTPSEKWYVPYQLFPEFTTSYALPGREETCHSNVGNLRSGASKG